MAIDACMPLSRIAHVTGLHRGTSKTGEWLDGIKAVCRCTRASGQYVWRTPFTPTLDGTRGRNKKTTRREPVGAGATQTWSELHLPMLIVD